MKRNVFPFLLLIIAQLLLAQSNARASTEEVDLLLPFEDDQIDPIKDRLMAGLQMLDTNDINIIGSDHWHRYQQGLRAGRKGIYLAPPHFAAWAIKHYNFEPIARLAQPLSYVIATRRDDSSLFEINDLDDKNVCSSKPLNIDYLLINQAFEDTFSSANIVIVGSVESAMREQDEKCTGFSISNHLFDQLSLEFPNRFIRLSQSQRYNNYVFIAHPEIPALILEKFNDYITSNNSKSLLATLYGELAENPDLVPAKKTDYPKNYWQQLEPYWKPDPK